MHPRRTMVLYLHKDTIFLRNIQYATTEKHFSQRIQEDSQPFSGKDKIVRREGIQVLSIQLN